MPTLNFTPNLRRHVETPAAQVNGATVRQVLEAYFYKHLPPINCVRFKL